MIDKSELYEAISGKNLPALAAALPTLQKETDWGRSIPRNDDALGLFLDIGVALSEDANYLETASEFLRLVNARMNEDYPRREDLARAELTVGSHPINDEKGAKIILDSLTGAYSKADNDDLKQQAATRFLAAFPRAKSNIIGADKHFLTGCCVDALTWDVWTVAQAETLSIWGYEIIQERHKSAKTNSSKTPEFDEMLFAMEFFRRGLPEPLSSQASQLMDEMEAITGFACAIMDEISANNALPTMRRSDESTVVRLRPARRQP